MSSQSSDKDKSKEKFTPLKVAFLHPDLGIGGAEQLMVNLALTCQKLGYSVKMFTPAYDPKRAFQQTKDGTLPVEIHGNCFPRLIFGRFHAWCESVRMLLCALYIIFFGESFDLIILDQIPLPIPLLNLRFKTLFYCHHPDKLLCTNRNGIFKKIYRFFIDLTEELTMSFAHSIVVNSIYTRDVYMKNFWFLSKIRKVPDIIYPSIDLGSYDQLGNKIEKKDLLKIKGLEALKDNKNFDINNTKVIVSMNRYERKKNLDLAVLSYLDLLTNSQKEIGDTILIIAGGYDTFLQENIEVFDKLNKYVDDYKKKDANNGSNLKVFFLKNISNDERSILLKTANVVLYTPKFEHFGIVPVESMYCGSWVIASNTGGPKESVVDGVTGNLLSDDEPKNWGLKIKEFLMNKEHFNENDNMNSEKLKNTLKEHVINNFSLKRTYLDLLKQAEILFKGRKVKKD